MSITLPVTIKKICDELASDLATLSGIKAAPAFPTEQAADWPFVTCYPKAVAESKIGPDALFTTWWDIVVEFHIVRLDLPADISEALTNYPEAILGRLHKSLQENNIGSDGKAGGITGEFGAMKWAGTDTLGYQFIIHRVKIQTAMPA